MEANFMKVTEITYKEELFADVIFCKLKKK
jgi:hypothetical protein